MSNRGTNLPVPFTFQLAVTAAGTPEQLQVKRRATTIAFVDGVAGPDTITDSGNGFITAGFEVGDLITVSGSASNDGTYELTAVAAGTLTLHKKHTLADESAGATVKIVASKSVPDGIAVNIKAKAANTGTIHLGNSSARALNTGGGSFSLATSEAIGLQVTNTDKVWIDSTVNGEGVEVFFERHEQN